MYHINGISFNEDCSCFAAAHSRGFKVFNSDPVEPWVSRDFGSEGGLSRAAILNRTNYLVLVGGGGPRMPRTKVLVWNDQNEQSSVLNFDQPVLNALISREVVICVLEHSVQIFSLAPPHELRLKIPTVANPKGLSALYGGMLVVPARGIGQIALVDLNPPTTNSPTNQQQHRPTAERKPQANADTNDLEHHSSTIPMGTQIEAPIENTYSSIEYEQRSIESGETSFDSGETPIHNAETSIDNFERPIHNVETSIDNAERPIHNAETSIHNAERPIDNVQTSIDNVQTSIDNSEARDSSGTPFENYKASNVDSSPFSANVTDSTTGNDSDPSVNKVRSLNDPGRTTESLHASIDLGTDGVDVPVQLPQVVSVLSCHRSALAAVAINDKYVVTASQTGTLIKCYDRQTQVSRFFRRGLDRARIYSLALSPNSTRLAVLSDKKTLHVFDLTSPANSTGSGNAAGKSSGQLKLGKAEHATNERHSLAAVAPHLYFGDEWSFARLKTRSKEPGVLVWTSKDSIVVVRVQEAQWEKYVLIGTSLMAEAWRAIR